MTLISVDIDGELLEEFRKFCVNKHGKIYGVMKPEMEEAIREHMKRKVK